jgi:hypothetical protein
MTKHTARTAFEAVAAMEEKHDLLRHEVDGWAVWTTLRFEIQQALLTVGFGSHAATLTRDQRMRFAFRDLLSMLTAGPHRWVVSTFSSTLLEERDGRFYDIHIDDLQPLLGDAYRIETLNSVAFLDRRARAAYPSHVTTSLIDLLTGLRTRRPASRKAREAAAAISDAVRSELGLDDITHEWVEIRLRYFIHGQNMYERFFRKLRPQALIVPDQMLYAQVAGARRAGVPVFELQHGVNDRYHPAYSWTDYAKPYRAKMPLPDRIFLFGEHWRAELDRSGFWGDALRVTGSAHMDHWRGRRARGEDTVLVFTGQGFDGARAAEWLEEALRDVADPSVRLFVRLHPVYASRKEEFASLARDPRVTILAATETPSTFELLARAALHISISSATHYDAISLGVPTVILPFTLHELVLPLHHARHAHLAESPRALGDLMNRARELSVDEAARGHYFAFDAVETLRRELAA